MECDVFKHKKGSKIHMCVDKNSMSLNFMIRPGNEHDSKKLAELM